MDNRTCVIIADNSEEFCSSLTAALHQTDRFQVIDTANDGERTVKLVSERKPDILVLDMMLAKKDGMHCFARSWRLCRVFSSGWHTRVYDACSAKVCGVCVRNKEISRAKENHSVTKEIKEQTQTI